MIHIDITVLQRTKYDDIRVRRLLLLNHITSGHVIAGLSKYTYTALLSSH
jgi:hypothetical protein